MKAYPSGWQAGLQGLSDTLGGTAEFQRDTQTIKARQSLAERELSQRQQEEQRRQRMLDLEVQQAQRKIAAEDAQRAFQYETAQQMLTEDRDALFQQIRGEEPTIQQAKELRNLDRLTQSLSPDTAPLVVEQYGTQRKSKASATGLRKWAQEIAQPSQAGVLTDPADQQQLQLWGQGAMQVADMVEQGVLKPNDAVDFIEQTNAKIQELQLKSAQRQQKLEAKQRVIGAIDTRAQGMIPGDPRAKKAGEMKSLVLSDMMDADDAGRILIAQDLGIPEERMTEFLDTVKSMVEGAGAGGRAVTRPADVVGDVAGILGMNRPQAPVAQAPAAQGGVPRGALVRLRDAVKAAQSPEEIDALASQLGIQQLTPEEKAFVLGG